MVIPQPFTTTSPAIVSFNFTDIASGTGYVTFYASKDHSAFFLSEQILYSSVAATQTTVDVSSTYATKFDQDLDVTFAIPKTIVGDLLASVPVSVDATGGGSPTVFHKVTVTVIHFDGSTETQLAQSVTGDIRTDESVGIFGGPITLDKDQIQTLKLPITRKHFKAGEILRINVKVETKGDASNAGTNVAIGHDPQGRLMPNDIGFKNLEVTSVMKFAVPFDINL